MFTELIYSSPTSLLPIDGCWVHQVQLVQNVSEWDGVSETGVAEAIRYV